MTMEKTVTKKNNGKVLKGVVVSTKMKDTVVISIDSFKKHPKYGKYIKKQNKIYEFARCRNYKYVDL